MILELPPLTILTDASGDFEDYVGSRIRGKVHAIKYDFGNLDLTLDFTITGETTGVVILTYTDVPAADAWWYPRAAAALNADGTAVTDSAIGPVELLNERIKVVVAGGGNIQTGTITFYIDHER